MIRVLHSVSNMDRAGIETMLMNYYRYMDTNEIQFDFLCNKKKPGAYDEEILARGGKIYHTPGVNPLKMLQYRSYMRKLFREHPEYQIVEAHNGAFGVYALHAAKINHIPVRIFHAHGASIHKDWKLPLKLICKAFLPVNMNEHYTCGTKAAKCYFGKKVVCEHDYVLVPNAIEVDRFTYDEGVRARVRLAYHLEGKHVIGHVGRFMSQKNHGFLLTVFQEVLKRDSQAFLVLLGDGELIEEMKVKAEILGISKQILFVGNVANVNEWYQAFDVFVLPSIWEGLPVVGVEAQAADLPCVFADTITKEIAFLDTTSFLSLYASPERWAEEIVVKMTGKKTRTDQSIIITRRGYNIKNEAKKLADRYMKLSEGRS